METTKAAQEHTPGIAGSGFLSEDRSLNDIDMAAIAEQLRKIAGLKLDHFTRLAESPLETTVQEMFSLIKDLERNLHDMLTLNASLRAELREQRLDQQNLRLAKEAAQRRIAVLERDYPRVQDLEQRLDLAVEEMEKLRLRCALETEKLEKSETGKRMLSALVEKIKEERDDAYREIAILADTLKSGNAASQ